MLFKILFILIAASSAVFLVYFFMIGTNQSVSNNNPVITELPLITPAVRQPGTFLTKNNSILSDEPLLTDRRTEEINPEFYKNTNKDDVFAVYYFSKTGNLTINLYDEDTAFAREEAEEYLQSILPYTESELCALDVTVMTNEFVNPALAGINLGFSFCPGSAQLP